MRECDQQPGLHFIVNLMCRQQHDAVAFEQERARRRQ
jgi:hypothetical protein